MEKPLVRRQVQGTIRIDVDDLLSGKSVGNVYAVLLEEANDTMAPYTIGEKNPSIIGDFAYIRPEKALIEMYTTRHGSPSTYNALYITIIFLSERYHLELSFVINLKWPRDLK